MLHPNQSPGVDDDNDDPHSSHFEQPGSGHVFFDMGAARHTKLWVLEMRLVLTDLCSLYTRVPRSQYEKRDGKCLISIFILTTWSNISDILD